MQVDDRQADVDETVNVKQKHSPFYTSQHMKEESHGVRLEKTNEEGTEVTETQRG